MGDLSDFQRRQIVGARLAGASVNKRAILLGVSRAAVAKAMTAYTNHGNTRQYRNKTVCVGCTERTLIVSFVILLFVCLFVLCSASVSALHIVFSNSLYGSMA